MAKRIKVLSEFVVNQIAAGEVIERPSSILKELLENSIDANSSMIKIYAENGGISLIKVVDDGDGIHPDDLSLALVQHATSKITNTEDLTSITSLGFRGEALASIASIAKVNIISRQTIPSGTTIEVKDIFYNLPARKKFLRSSTTEYNYLQEIFKRIALSNFNVGFMFYHNHKLIKHLPAINCASITDNLKSKEQRISKLIGNSFINEVIFFNSKIDSMQLCGWLSASGSIATSYIQYFYINNRLVKDKLLNMAIKQAVELIGNLRFYCLYLYLEPSFLDVNVHPTKQEVRFSEPKMVYAFVQESIKEAIRKFQVKSDAVNSSLENNDDQNVCTGGELQLNEIQAANNNYNYPLKDQTFNKFIKNKWQNALFDTFNHSKNINALSSDLVTNHINDLNCYSDCIEENDSKKEINNDYNIIPIFDNKYLIFGSKDFLQQVVFLDVINSIKWLVKTKLNKIESSKVYNLIIPERIKFDNLKFDLLKFKIELLAELKFEITQIHDSVLLIRAIPDCLNLFDLKINYLDFFKELLTIKDNYAKANNIKEKIIELLLLNLEIAGLNLYTKKEFLSLIVKLKQEQFNFFKLNQKQFEMVLQSSNY